MSATQEWIKEQFAKEQTRIITEYSLQAQIDKLSERVKTLEEEIAWRAKDNG
jgi:hypothetical protein|tara:strand:+ start:610 stop:765 length:156 start_codon:yes stop_codon:yes gene_type:complete